MAFDRIYAGFTCRHIRARRELHRARHAARVKARPGLDVRTHSRGHVLRQGLLQTLVQTGLPQLPPCVRVGLPQRRV
jgi:hypothetical protein